MEEVKKHQGEDGTYWTVLNGNVYDLTDFMTQVQSAMPGVCPFTPRCF